MKPVEWKNFFTGDVQGLDQQSHGWITDMMIVYQQIAFEDLDFLIRCKYVGNYTCNIKKIEQDQTEVESVVFVPRDDLVPSAYKQDFLAYSLFLFQVTFRFQDTDRVALIFIRRNVGFNDLFVFFPFPNFINQSFGVLRSMDYLINMVIDSIQKSWFEITGSNHPVVPHPQIHFPPSFADSNLYCIYTVFLMRYRSVEYETVRKIFEDESLGLLLQEKAFETYRNMGIAISECLQNSVGTVPDSSKKLVRGFQENSGPVKFSREMLSVVFSMLLLCRGTQENQRQQLVDWIRTLVPQHQVVGKPIEDTDAVEKEIFRNFLPERGQPAIPVRIRI